MATNPPPHRRWARGGSRTHAPTGIGLIGALTATVASFFVDESANRDQQRLEERLDRIEMMLARALGQSSLKPVDLSSATAS